jgi:hypothetical protein
MRGDSRPQLGYRIDTLLDLRRGVPGACGALVRLVPRTDEAADQECSFRETLRKYIETPAQAPAPDLAPILEEPSHGCVEGYV